MIGQIVEFKGSGPVYGILSRLIKIFEPWWDRWGWHVGFICGEDTRGIFICEAVADGVRIISLKDVVGEYRIHNWFGDNPPNQEKVNEFVNQVTGARYDVAIYLWTGLQYVFRHLLNRRIPRLLDDRYTCWELCAYVCREMGKPWGTIYDCPLITDMIEVMEKSDGQ